MKLCQSRSITSLTRLITCKSYFFAVFAPSDLQASSYFDNDRIFHHKKPILTLGTQLFQTNVTLDQSSMHLWCTVYMHMCYNKIRIAYCFADRRCLANLCIKKSVCCRGALNRKTNRQREKEKEMEREFFLHSQFSINCVFFFQAH